MTTFQQAAGFEVINFNEQLETFSVTPVERTKEQAALSNASNNKPVDETSSPSTIQGGLQTIIDQINEPSQQGNPTQIESSAGTQLTLSSGTNFQQAAGFGRLSFNEQLKTFSVTPPVGQTKEQTALNKPSQQGNPTQIESSAGTQLTLSSGTNFQQAAGFGRLSFNEQLKTFSVTPPVGQTKEQTALNEPSQQGNPTQIGSSAGTQLTLSSGTNFQQAAGFGRLSFNEQLKTFSVTPPVGQTKEQTALNKPSQQGNSTQIASITDRQITLGSGQKIEVRHTNDPHILKIGSQEQLSLNINWEAVRAGLQHFGDLSNVASVTISSDTLKIEQRGAYSQTPVIVHGSFARDILSGATFAQNELVLKSGHRISLTFDSSLQRLSQTQLQSFARNVLARSGCIPESVTAISLDPLRSVVTQQDGAQTVLDTGLLKLRAPNLPKPANKS